MVEPKVEGHLVTPEEIGPILESMKREELPSRPPVRPEDATFAEFMDKATDAMIRDHADLVKQLL